MRFIRAILAMILSAIFLVSCVSTTIIKSTTPGTKIFVDGNLRGEDSVSYSDKKVVGSATIVELKKPGYKEKTTTIRRNSQLNVGALVGGILLAPTIVGLAFFLWILDYEPVYVFELEKEGQS